MSIAVSAACQGLGPGYGVTGNLAKPLGRVVAVSYIGQNTRLFEEVWPDW
jgi:hypothetical protein